MPLTVSPFVTLPTAATLPYTYKSMPSTLPVPSTGITGGSGESTTTATARPQYVVSASGHAAHPDDIVASCEALRAHLARLLDDAARELAGVDDRIRARQLAEKRRVAPGWLDSEARLLEPERGGGGRPDGEGEGGADVAAQLAEMSIVGGREHVSEMAVDQGEELDRAFGGLK